MSDEKNTATFSQMDFEKSVPARGDEATTNAVEQPAAPSTPTEDAAHPSEESQEVVTGQQQPVEKEKADEDRIRGLQRALSERDRKLHELEIRMDTVLKMGGNPNGQREAREPVRTQADIEAEVKALEEEVRNDPGKMVGHMYRIMALRDQHWQNQIVSMNTEMQRRMVSGSPEYREVQEQITALSQEIPDFNYLPPEAQVAAVRKMKALFGATSSVQQPPAPPAGVGGTRKAAPQTVKPISNEERFKSQLLASGAIKSGNGSKTVSFFFER